MYVYIHPATQGEEYREQGNGPKTKSLWQSLAESKVFSREAMIGGIGGET